MKQVKARIIDHTHLELDQPINGKPGEVINISIPIDDLDNNKEEPFDITKDPIYQLDGYDSDGPADLSVNIDKYLYGEKNVK